YFFKLILYFLLSALSSQYNVRKGHKKQHKPKVFQKLRHEDDFHFYGRLFILQIRQCPSVCPIIYHHMFFKRCTEKPRKCLSKPPVNNICLPSRIVTLVQNDSRITRKFFFIQ